MEGFCTGADGSFSIVLSPIDSLPLTYPPPPHLTKKQVLVDAPGITRCVISLRRLAVTSLVVDLNETRSPSKAVLTAAVKAADVDGKWAASAWGKKLARQAARKNLSDFDRYKVMVARTKRKALIAKALA